MGLSVVLVGMTYGAFLLDIWIPSGAALLGIGLMGVWGVLYFYIQELQEYNRLLVAQVNQKTQHLEEALIQLQTTQNQLIQQEKLTAMSSLVGNLSHELKNPLWALGNRLEILTVNPAMARGEGRGGGTQMGGAGREGETGVKSGEWVGGDVASGSPGGVTPEFGEGDGGDDCGVGGEVGLSPG